MNQGFLPISRKEMLESIRYVDLVIPEENWEQKKDDVLEYKIDTVVMGSDWANSDRFDYLKEYCEVKYLDRTEGISTTKIKQELNLSKENLLREGKSADTIYVTGNTAIDALKTTVNKDYELTSVSGVDFNKKVIVVDEISVDASTALGAVRIFENAF